MGRVLIFLLFIYGTVCNGGLGLEEKRREEKVGTEIK